MLGLSRFTPSMSRDDELNALNNNFSQIENASAVSDEAAGAYATSWPPTQVGFSSAPTNSVYNYTVSGKTVTLFISQSTDGTSNSATFTISLPFKARTLTNMRWLGIGNAYVAGASDSTPTMLSILSGGTTLSVLRNWGAGTFPTSGGKRLSSGTITYERE